MIEVSELALEIQAKLLRVLQERTFYRVGGTQSSAADARVVAASNKPLQNLTREGKFREDLYHRLDLIRISIPPLRLHREDIAIYANNTILRAGAGLGSSVRSVSAGALDLLRAYLWPGNIRELDHVIQRAMVFAESETLEARDVSEAMPPGASPSGRENPAGLEHRVRLRAEETERRLIVEALEKTGWNKAAAAEVLHISRRSLYNKIERYAITEPGSG